MRPAARPSPGSGPNCSPAWPGSPPRCKADAALAERIRHKFRIKNTTGYSLNALLDYDDPIDILTHLMIGSEGTLGFISEITYRTVPEHPHKASALILFDELATACRAVTLLKRQPVDAVELADRAALRSVQGKPGLPAALAEVGADGAALLVETRAADAATLHCADRGHRSDAGRRGHARAGRAFRPTPPNAPATGRCARACSRRWARCAPPAPR